MTIITNNRSATSLPKLAPEEKKKSETRNSTEKKFVK